MAYHDFLGIASKWLSSRLTDVCMNSFLPESSFLLRKILIPCSCSSLLGSLFLGITEAICSTCTGNSSNASVVFDTYEPPFPPWPRE